MKSIKIVSKGKKLGRIVPSGYVRYNIFRQAIGESWTSYNQDSRKITLNGFIHFHNETSHIQIEKLETESITLD